MADKVLWNDGWEFVECPIGNNPGIEAPDGSADIEYETEKIYQTMPAQGWRELSLPHDWLIEDVDNLYRDSMGWYRKRFVLASEIPAGTEADVTSDGIFKYSDAKKYLVRFDGVYMDSTIFVNGRFVKEWKYGYSTFEADVTPYLIEGENEIAVRVVNQYLNTRWYSGAGIYRNVWWKECYVNHIASDGIYITPVPPAENAGENVWQVEIDTELHIENRPGSNKISADGVGQQDEAQESGQFMVRQTIFAPDGTAAAQDETHINGEVARTERAALCTEIISQTLRVSDPLLWDIGRGNLYRLATELYCGGKLLEKEEQAFGFRRIECKADGGFFINGRHEKINGVCEHHDFGCLGAAFHKDAMRRKFLKLREMGVNAIRTSHNMPAPELMELADEMGFLIDSESFDMWEKSKTPYDYARFFKEWYAKDVASWIRRDRNHPSVIMWSIGNEIQDTVADVHGQEITAYLVKEVKKHDPKRHAPITLGSNYLKWDNAIGCTAQVDLAGYNYSEYLYEDHHKKYPSWVIYGSETASVLASRGVYHFPRSQYILTEEDEQCSALGNSITGWGAKSYEKCITNDRDAAWSLGQFLWTGFDYIGESTPYQTKNSYFGQLDTAGFPKDSYYIFQAEWTDYKTAPMVHLFPYWDFNPGQMIDVQACTNAPCVEVFVNGKSMGKETIDHRQGKKLVPCYAVPYEPGCIEAVAYDEKGNVVAREERHSFGDAVKICAEAETISGTTGSAQGVFAKGANQEKQRKELEFIQISVKDKDGYPVENANNRIFVEVEGDGALLGLDNGDSTDFESYQQDNKRLFSGKLLAVVKRQGVGKIIVKISSPGLEGCNLILAHDSEEAFAPDIKISEQGSYVNQNNASFIRKIELRAEGSCHLTPEHPQVFVRMKVYPEPDVAERKNGNVPDAGSRNDHRDMTGRREDVLEWKAVNDTGLAVPFVKIEKTEGGFLVSSDYDGAFRLRVLARNGKRNADVMSQLEMEASGFGDAVIHPYREVFAALSVYRSEQALEGVEHGINCLGEAEEGKHAVFGFERVDFGVYGTEEITVDLFANTENPVSIRLWDGVPEKEGSVMVLDEIYHKQPEWMVFQPETYRLSKRLRGQHDIYFETADSYQFKSFVFAEIPKAFERLRAVSCDRLYGDCFTRTEEAIEKIGNNVSLVFENMDFGAVGACQIMIKGKTDLAIQPIQIRWTVNLNLMENSDLQDPSKAQSVQLVEFKKSEAAAERIFELEPLYGKGTLEFLFLPGSSFDFLEFQFM